jgi:hypothetical protein
MRFGGHQTFYIREGWLHKGLDLLLNNPSALIDEFAFDHLGVGRNMAISIQHWLQATGLAVKEGKVKGRGRPSKILTATPISDIIWDSDKYLALPETWWMLHINLLHNREHGESWYWFFNHFNVDRFDRTQCLRKIMKYAKEELGEKPPSEKTIERDLSCLVSTYSTDIPSRVVDPEDDLSCPFRELELMVTYRESGYVHLQRQRRLVTPEIVMYALELCLRAHVDNSEASPDVSDIQFFDLVRLPNNPLRVFLLNTDSLFEMLLYISRNAPETGLSIVGLAGDRQIRIPRKAPEEWITDFFRRRSDVA